MQKFLLVLIAMASVSETYAQVKEGIIIYERKINMHKRLPAADASMKNFMPEWNISKTQVLFSGEESIFNNIQEEEHFIETAGDDGGVRMDIRMAGQENETYKNYGAQKLIELRELGPKKYIIEDSLQKFKWQLKDDTKIIQGFNCKKATTVNAGQKEVIAWYAEEITCPSGPENWGGLPGMILEMNIDQGSIIYTAVLIEKSLKKQTVKAPTGGKKITKAAFAAMIKESGGSEGPGRRIIVRDIN